MKGTDETRRNLERLKEESIKKNMVILGARRGEDIAPRIGNTITTLCAKIGDIARFLEMGVRSRAGPILPTKSDPDLMIQAIVPAPEELLDYFADEIRQKVKGRADASSHYYKESIRGNTRRAPWDSGAAWKRRRGQGPRVGGLVCQWARERHFGDTAEEVPEPLLRDKCRVRGSLFNVPPVLLP